MKIYCVTAVIGQVTEHHVHTKYQSACQSLAYWNQPWKGRTATLTAAWVSTEGWKPVDAAVEKRLAKVQKVLDELVESDREALDALLDSFVAKQRAPVLASGGIVMGSLLREEERTEAMLRLNRLVDAQ